MFNTLLIFTILHLICDFYLQSENHAAKKDKDYKVVLSHSLLYMFSSIILILPLFSIQSFIGVIILAILHFIIDSLKFYYINNTKDKIKLSSIKIFCIDQLLHLICIIIVSFLYIKFGYSIKFIFNQNIYLLNALKWVFVIVILHKPANIFISKFLDAFRVKDDSIDDVTNDSYIKAGRYIGTVERYILVILLSMNQFTAIGFVIAAKSITRYDKIQKEPAFAEYYLLGTLLSSLIVILVSMIFYI